MAPYWLKKSLLNTASRPLAERPSSPVERWRWDSAQRTERAHRSLVSATNQDKDDPVPDSPDPKCPPPVLSKDPDSDLERRLRKNPDNLDAKADVGSDESMDASDPSSATQPGQDDKPVPSSGFPD